MRWPGSSRIITATPVVELENNKRLILTFGVWQDEYGLWQVTLKSCTRYMSSRIPSSLIYTNAQVVIINSGHNKKNYQLSVAFFTQDGYAVYPILELNSIDQLHQELYVYIQADRNNIKIYCVKETQYSGSFPSFPCVISEMHLSERNIIEDIRSN